MESGSLLFLGALAFYQAARIIRPVADLLLLNGKIHTMDAAQPLTRAIAFSNGRVLALGEDAIAQRGPRTEVIDLRERTVIPGLVDSHIHFTGYAMGMARVQLEGARSLEEAVARVEARARRAEPGELILGSGWNHQDWTDPRFPTKAPLDRAAPRNPVVLDRKDGHSVWLNSAALKMAHISRETADPAGGVVERDADGEPTGLLRENAMKLVSGPIGFDADKVSEKPLLDAIRRAHRLGLTGIHNVEGANALKAFQSLHSKGLLNLRVLHMIPVENLEHAVALGLQTGLGDEWLRIGGVKIFADGSLGSQTAHLLEPFEGQPGNCGVAVTPPEEIERLAVTAANAGLMVATHAIGDRAIRDVLDAYEKLRREMHTAVLRIEHVQHIDPADLPRFKELNVTASMQPIHAPSDYRMAERLLGKRARYSYAFRSLLGAGAKLIFGSDCPVETLDPLAGIHAAVTRQRVDGDPAGGWFPEERVSVEEAVGAYTRPLRAGSGQGENGAPGDCVVLSQDIFSIPPREILETKIEYTIAGGQFVYAA